MRPRRNPVIQPVAPTPVVTQSGDWTGAYGGVTLSYGDISSSPGTADGDGALYGLRAGYDYDFGSFVLGGSIGYDFSDIDVGGGDTLDGLATLKLRGGYDLGNTLIYASGGLAQANATVGGVDEDDTGYVLGVGAEYKMTTNVSLTGEIDYHKFDDFAGTGSDIEATTIKAGINYRF